MVEYWANINNNKILVFNSLFFSFLLPSSRSILHRLTHRLFSLPLILKPHSLSLFQTLSFSLITFSLPSLSSISLSHCSSLPHSLSLSLLSVREARPPPAALVAAGRPVAGAPPRLPRPRPHTNLLLLFFFFFFFFSFLFFSFLFSLSLSLYLSLSQLAEPPPPPLLPAAEAAAGRPSSVAGQRSWPAGPHQGRGSSRLLLSLLAYWVRV